MVVRAGTSGQAEDSNLFVEISSQWQKKSRLDDRRILEVAKTAKKLESALKKDLEIDFEYETGNLYVTNVAELKVKKPKHTKAPKEKASKTQSDQPVKPRGKQVDIEKLEKEIVSSLQKTPPFIETSRGAKPKIKLDTIRVQKRKLVTEIEIPKLRDAEKKELVGGIYEWVDELDLKVDFYIDVSTLNSSLLANAKYFKGLFLDGTELVLSSNRLPEKYLNQKEKLKELVEA